MVTLRRHEMRVARHKRVRKRVSGTAERPRLCVFRSNRHMYAQIIDDEAGRCLVSAASLERWFRESHSHGSDVAAARAVGEKLAEKARAKGIDRVVFDRNGYKFHGRVKALAEAVRENGIVL